MFHQRPGHPAFPFFSAPAANPGPDHTDLTLRAAERLLKSNAGLARLFFETMGYVNDPWVRDQVLEADPRVDMEPMLLVNYFSGEDQHWAGHPSDWPEQVREYHITVGEIQNWDVLRFGKIVDNGFDDTDPMAIYVFGMEAAGLPWTQFDMRPAADQDEHADHATFYDEDGELLPPWRNL